MYDLFDLIGLWYTAIMWVIILSFISLFYIKFTKGEKKKVVKSIFIVVISYILTYTTMLLSSFITGFTMYMVFALDRIWVDDIMSLLVWVVFNWLILLNPVKEKAVVFKKDWKSAIAIFSILLMFGNTVYWQVSSFFNTTKNFGFLIL